MTLSRQDILRLAAEAQLDPRTIQRALTHGVESLHSEFAQQRLREAATKLSLEIEPKRKR
jgi:hypothetical protein